MIDYLAIGLTHLLLALAALRLLSRKDLDREAPPAPSPVDASVPPATPSAAPVPHGGVARLPGLGRPRGGRRA